MASQPASNNASRKQRNAKRLSTAGAKKLSRGQVRKALKESSLEFLHGRFDTMLADLDAALFEQANQSASNSDQAQFLEAMTLLREDRAAVLKGVWTEFAQNYDQYFEKNTVAGQPQQKNKASEIDFNNLELVDQAEWEDDLAISILASRVESACAQSLWALNQRLAVLCGGRVDEDKDNPLGPIALAKALQVAITQFDITEKAKTSVYAQFNKSVLEHMEEFLTSSNDLLAEKGILPDLKYNMSVAGKKKIESGPSANSAAFDESASLAAQQAAAQERANLIPPHWQESMRAEQQLLDAIIKWQLQNLAMSSTGITGAGVPLGALFSANAAVGEQFTSTDYVSVLNDLQEARKYQLEGGVVTAPSVVEFQKEFVDSLTDYSAEAEEDKKVPAADAGTIDLVGTIFNQILEEETLCSKVKALLSHLHTPFLKIALIDRSFMQEADHPARMLLNELAEAAAYWITDDDDKFRVYDKIYQVVHRTIDDFDDDIDFIDQLREDFAHFSERLKKRVQLAEKRSSQAEEGLDKIEVARKKAHELFGRRAEAKSIPVAACDILEQTWVDFLVFVYLRFGAESEIWKKAVLMLNQAFVRVHAALLTGDNELSSTEVEAELRNESGADSAQTAILQIDAQLRSDILDLGYAEQDVENMFALIQKASDVRPEDEWRAQHVNREEQKEKIVNPGIDIGAPEVDPSLEADINLEFEVSQLADDLDDQEKELREQLKAVAYGTWFEWLQGDGNVDKKLKLAWYSSMSDNYMFVNQAGVKVLVETLNNLTRNVHRGHIRVININNESFMERMFKRMVNNMQTSA
ncbi:MAG: DUF1631 family protein [Pseudomonadales bacterium]